MEAPTVTHGFTSTMVRCVCGETFSASGTFKKVTRLHDAWSKKHADCTQKPRTAKTFWLSFCDAEKPKGQQFLGACIIDVTPEDAEEAMIDVLLRFPLAEPDAEYIGAAVRKAHQLGCNPGGSVKAIELPTDHPRLRHYQKGVLMDRATIERIDKQIERH